MTYSPVRHELIFFDSASPQQIRKRVPISGLPGREYLRAIDIRPLTGDLYGFGSDQRLYRIDQATGHARAVGAPALTLNLPEPVKFAMDFDPVTDQVRLIAGSSIFFRMNPDTGAVIAFDPALSFAPGQSSTGAVAVANAAYTYNLAGASTTLYGINDTNLVRIGSPDGNPVSPDTGQVFTVGSLGIDTRFAFEVHGFDIAPLGNKAFILTHGGTAPGLQGLYSVNLLTGAAQFLGEIGRNEYLWALTLPRTTISTPMIALTKTNKLLRFQSDTPGRTNRTLSITGLPTGESIVDIDVNYINDYYLDYLDLYGLSDAARLYRIRITPGEAFAVATPVSTASLLNPEAGDAYSFDFHPRDGHLRIVTATTRENRRFAPNTGALLARGGQLAYAANDRNAGHTPHIVGSAYAREYYPRHVAFSSFYGIDSARDTVVVLGSIGEHPVSPDTGQLFTMGALGVDAPDALGFDTDLWGIATYAVFKVANVPRPVLYNINRLTGAAEAVGTLNTTEEVRGLAVLSDTPRLHISGSSYTVNEGAGSVAVKVRCLGRPEDFTSVEYDSADETASGQKDYNAVHGTLTFAPGECEKTVNIFINDDAFREDPETFIITLKNASGGTIPVSPTIVTIVDNDASDSSSNPIDDNEPFVRQHYRDFLYREPEPDGLAAWINVLRRCPNIYDDPLCNRVTVSSAFFRSLEFQDKGYFIYRYYKVGLNGQRPRYVNFLRDVRRLDGQTAEEIAAQKNAFAADWVTRRSFTELYDETSSPRVFLNDLVAFNGLKLSSAEKESLIADMEAGRKTRADVVRHIVELPQVLRDEYDDAFVAMQYFGYLQRDPDEDGFINWTTYLKNHPGDFRTMVHGFVNSVEYRARFGKP
ncbi:MAG TPA: DUF4394 domain-containing protein [Pyrinomonadaceae bacterium]|nr:DUF4394 domain-containing protein [Pyrinomonadaceae bacterium]